MRAEGSLDGTAWLGLLVAIHLGVAGGSAYAQHDRVASTLHNLSASGPGEVRALNETEVCKFCHIPHSAVLPVPLWGHRLSDAQYATPETSKGKGDYEAAPQPDGSSRLCLSCHDGTVALGDIGGSPTPIAMAGSQRLGADRRGHLGTDLTGSHPISFVVREDAPAQQTSDRDMGLNNLAAIQADEDVRLDEHGKMQCTTCHDAHADRHFQEGRVPHFWVKPTVEEVCLTCHVLR